MVDEAKLLSDLKRGKRGAIDFAIETYTPYLSTVLYNLAGKSLPKEDMEEIISDVFIALWKNAGKIDLKRGTLKSYIAAATRNFALKALNRRREFIPLEEIEPANEVGLYENAVEAEAVWDAVMRLGEPDNEIFVRFYKYGESLKGISRATGLNISTVKSKLSRGRRKLKKILNMEESI